jgi:hypothetical protein
VTGVIIERYGRRQTVAAKVTIDATGTGAVAIAAGCEARYGQDARDDFGEEPAPEGRTSRVQHVTWMYVSQKLGNVPHFDMTRLDNKMVLADGAGWYHRNADKARELDPAAYLHWGCAVACADTRDPVAVAAAQDEARRAMERDHALLREAGYGIHLSPRIGIRESSRIMGEHVITYNDLMSGRYPEDKIAEGWYGIDIWGASGGETHALIHQTPAYGLPYRATLPKEVDGLFLAGKAISGTHIAMSAYRVMPIVGAAGQSTGVAAALCVKQGCQPREADPDLVRARVTAPPQNLQLDNWGP